MFLGLGGSRRRAGTSVSSPPLQQQQQEFGLQPQQQLQGDPLRALATGKYAPTSLMLLRSESCEVDPGGFRSPRSTLNLSWETVSRASGDSSGAAAGEEASSRFPQQSPALALAKKLRNSLGSKFADSLRETIKEVAKRESSEAWPQLLEGISRSESDVWPVEQDACNVVDRSARVTSKVSSWLPQASWEVEAVPSLSSSMDSPFFPSGGHSSLLGEGDRGQWLDGFTSSRPAAVPRRHFFPEAAAMGPSRSDPLLIPQISKPNLQETHKDQSLVDVFEGFQSSGKDCRSSFLEFLNPGHPSNQALLDDARHRLYGRPDSVSKISGYGAPVEFDGGVLKRPREEFPSGRSSKRQCVASDSVLLGIPNSASDSEYFTERESSYELPGSSLAELMEDLSQDLLIPHVAS